MTLATEFVYRALVGEWLFNAVLLTAFIMGGAILLAGTVITLVEVWRKLR